MKSKKLLIRIVFLILIIFLLNYLAMKFYWYSSIWYFDMLMHFFGGVWIGFASIYLFSPKNNSFGPILKILLIVLFVGVGWEIFEILINEIITKNSFNFLDTFSDLFFDLAGGTFAVFYSLRKIVFFNKNTL